MKFLAPVGRWSVLVLWPLLAGMLVAASSGWPWGVADAVAIYAWWLPALVFRRVKVTWHLRHQRLAFVMFSFVYATLFFAFPAAMPIHALTRVPMGICALVAALLGAGVTLALWPAQRRFAAVKLAQLRTEHAP